MQLASYGKTLDKAQRYERTVREEQSRRKWWTETVCVCRKGTGQTQGKICTGEDEREEWRSHKVLEKKKAAKDEMYKGTNAPQGLPLDSITRNG